mmetsp:Transcript_1205/g.7921  ORF Transcript_1205/g.7921 Transcript_1205/m.7921 type:complete len:224 (-) Transcript_1205:242-913(-)
MWSAGASGRARNTLHIQHTTLVRPSPGPAASATIPPHSSRAFGSRRGNGSTGVGDCVRRSTVSLRVGNRGFPSTSSATFPFGRSTFCRFRCVFVSHFFVDHGDPRCLVSFVSHRAFRQGWTIVLPRPSFLFSLVFFPRRPSPRLVFFFLFFRFCHSHRQVLRTHLCFAQQSTGATTEDRRRRVGIERRFGPLGLLRRSGGRFFSFGTHDDVGTPVVRFASVGA